MCIRDRYKTEDGRTLLFRPDKNIERANNSNRRLCIPEINPEDFLQAIKAVVKMDEAWIPTKEGTSLYIRPFVIATDPFLGVRPSDTYKFMIILSPVGAYYPEGLNPVKIWIEDEYVRAVKGGIGEAKTGGNYVASLASQVKAHDEGYSQVLWLDGVHRKYIEEVGAMNIFFKINGTVVTPKLNGSIPVSYTHLVSKKDPNELEIWEKALVAAGDEKCDWTDKKYLKPILEAINK